jgi:hypothetical protein
MNKIYTRKEIDELIAEYKKTPTPEVSLEIFKAFEGFILKYAHFLKYRYIKAFPKDKDLHSLMKMLNISDIHNSPILKIFDTWDFSEIFNQLYLIFLESIKLFTRRKEGPYFVGYLSQYYKFMVKEWIAYLSHDALNSVNTHFIESDEDIEENYKDIKEYENICLTEKTPLTQLEKYILYLSYGKKLTMDEISELLDIHRVYLQELKNKAKDKLLGSGIILDDLEKPD